MSTKKEIETFFTQQSRNRMHPIEPMREPQTDRETRMHYLERQLSCMRQRDHDIWFVKTMERDAGKQDRAREELKKLGIPFRVGEVPP